MNRKVKIAAVLLAAGLLAGCGQEQKQNSQIPWESRESVETEIEEIDFSASQYFWDSISRVQRGKEGYYWLVNSVLRYKDWKTGQIVPLCSKPECRHGEDGCNAKLANMEKYPNLSRWEEFLRYCDDKLYLIMDYRDGEETVLDLNGNLIQVLEAPNGDGYFYPYWGDQEILLVDQGDKFVYYDKKGKVWKEWEG